MTFRPCHWAQLWRQAPTNVSFEAFATECFITLPLIIGLSAGRSWSMDERRIASAVLSGLNDDLGGRP